MKRKKKKIVKLRGSKTHGYGSKKKHRGKGSKGGKGRAGVKGHKRIWLLKHGKSLGKRGFKSLAQRAIKQKPKSINLRDIAKLGKKEIDVTELGYERVLGSGMLKEPVIIKAKYFSKRAIEKIEQAGGKALKIE